MEKSQNYRRRQDLMKKLEVPLMREVKKELGEKFSAVVFKECAPAMQEKMGLKPTLDGPGPELWVSPSDLLYPKVCLKPPISNKYIRALTHEGILEIGQDIDRRFWLQMEREKLDAIEEQRQMLKHISERELRVAIKLTKEEERGICVMHVEKLMEEFEIRLTEELSRLEEYMLELQDKAVLEAIEECDVEWTAKLQSAITETVNTLTEQYLEGVEKEKEQLRQSFIVEFEKQNTEFNYALKLEHKFCDNTLQQLKHCLECKNLANLMYVLCMERRKCGIERCTLEYIYKNKIAELENELEEKNEQISVLKSERDRNEKQIKTREVCLLEILKQFQKFINYALRSTPTQAEFLLSVEKMVLYEAARQTSKQSKKARKRAARRILPWKSDSSIAKEDKQSSKKIDLEPTDHHECLNEIIPPGAQSDVLPYFYYKDKMYVRGDLEAMFRNGVEISQTNMLWNSDVENLMHILKANIADNKSEKEETAPPENGFQKDYLTPEQELEIPVDEAASLKYDDKPKGSKISKQPSDKSAVNFPTPKKSMLKNIEETSIQPVLYCSVSQTSQPCLKSTIDEKKYQDIEIAPIETTGLLAVQDSLTTIRLSRKSSLKGACSAEIETANTLIAVRQSLDSKELKPDLTDAATVSFEHFEAVRILDEIELSKPSSKPSKSSLSKQPQQAKANQKQLGESILTQKQKPPPMSPSKLVQAVDSLIIHRNSLQPKDVAKLPTSQTQASPPAPLHHGSIMSKLSFTRDSLELIRKQSIHSKKETNGEEVIIISRGSSKISTSMEKHKVHKVISPLTMSHIEIAKIPTEISEGAVNFSPIHEVYETNVLMSSDSPWRLYQGEEKKSSRDNFLTKPDELHVVGDPKGKEGLQSNQQFVSNRISSVLNILKQDPSLIRLFTGVTH